MVQCVWLMEYHAYCFQDRVPAAVEVVVVSLWVETTVAICLHSVWCFFRSLVNVNLYITLPHMA